MSKQTEAERLAGHLEFPDGCPNEYIMRMQAAAELRRLVSFNQQLMDEVARLQKREWVELTDEEFQWIYDNGRTPAGMMELTEAKLKEKNT